MKRKRHETEHRSGLPGAWILGLAVAGLAAVALILLASSGAPEVPDADRSHMEPQVAAKIQEHRERVYAAPDSHSSWGELGVVFQAHGLNEQAAECYRRALELAPSAFRWHYLLVHALRAFDRDATLLASERAVEVRSDYPALLVVRAEILEESDPSVDVTPLYEKALAHDPGSASAELGLGRIAMARGDLEGARSHLERAARLSPDAGAVHAMLARLYRRLGENDRAVEEAQKASLAKKSVPINDPIHFRMTQEAVSSTAAVLRARSLEEAGDLEGAEAIYRNMVALRPDDADMRARLGDVLSLSDRHPEAKEHYRKALEIKDDHAGAHFGLGAALSRGGSLDEAVQHFERSLALRPDHVPTLVSLASTLAFRGNDDEALARYQRAIELEPKSVAAHRSLAEFYFRQHRYQEAARHYLEVVEVDPELGPVHLQLGAALAMTGDYDEAKSHLERARELGQTIPETVVEKVELGLQKQ